MRAAGYNQATSSREHSTVIGANGTLVDYGGGLTRKAWLLQLGATVMARNAWR